ncbi:MAG TPA: S8 family serine peptidase [Bacillales bacterium]|nr:S8 family serine peptidase [Bacillales bacterium]
MKKKGVMRSTALFTSLILAGSLFSIPTFATDNNSQKLDTSTKNQTNQVIVKLKKPTTQNKIGVYQVVENGVGGDHSLVTVKVPNKESVTTAMNAIDDRKDVEYVEPDYKMKLKFVPNDPGYPDQWFHQVIHSAQAWDTTRGSSDVIVAVIDDGIDPEQPDLKDQLVDPYDMFYDTNEFISVGAHGTHVSGIIAAAADNNDGGSGVAPGVKIMPINVFADDDSAYTSDIINGIYYAIDYGAKIINMSIGDYEESTALNDAIQEAYSKGVVIVAAAGNDHSFKKVYPASYPNVISVTSTDDMDHISSYANFGDSVDIAAPGEDILSTFPDDEYGYMSGTSMAAPIVSGVAALVWSEHPDFTNTQVVNYLMQSADDLGAYGKDSIYGAGRVNAAKALKLKLYDQPTINPFSDQDTTISGKVSDTIHTGKVIVSNNQGVIGTGEFDSNNMYAIPIPKQQGGTILTVKVDISEDNKSLPQTIKVLDITPPAVPNVTEIGDSTSIVTGKAEINSKVTISLGNKVVGVATANSQGIFSVKIPLQKAGAILSIISTDQSGNQSQPLTLTVKDKTGPTLSKVYPITNLDTTVKGAAEANAKIFVKVGSKIIGTAKTASNQHFVVTIPKQKEYTKISIVGMDRYNNVSTPVVITVLDRIPPKRPVIYPVTSRTTSVSGKTEAYNKVFVKTGNIKLGESKANSKGYYRVRIKKQSKGRSITIYVYDQGGNRNETSTKVR